MTQVTEAIYSDGVLKPVSPLDLLEQERVRVIVQQLDEPPASERSAALDELLRDAAESTLHLTGRLPTREELHDRV